MKRIIGVVLGILMCIGGYYCMATPALTFASIAIVFGITLIERAIANFVLWYKLRKTKLDRGLLLVNAILSLLCGIGLLTNSFTQLFVDTMILTIISIVMTASGIIEIVDAIKVDRNIEGAHWVLSLIGGILVLIGGIFSLTNPLVLSITLGLVIAIDIFAFGIGLIVRSLAH